MSSRSARSVLLAALAAANLCFAAWSAPVVPTDIQQPGTQPGEAGTLESPDKCDNCHGNYNRAVEPAFNWRGSMMANAGRDPIFWATLAVAEQDFDGSGDLCIRCHSTAGWQAGRSTPTDGSGLDRDRFGRRRMRGLPQEHQSGRHRASWARSLRRSSPTTNGRLPAGITVPA